MGLRASREVALGASAASRQQQLIKSTCCLQEDYAGGSRSQDSIGIVFANKIIRSFYMRADIPEYPSSSSPGRTASAINFFAGIWVLISPFVLRFTGFRFAIWNNVIVGIIVLIVAGTRAWGGRGERTGVSWINLVLGIWLIVTAFIFHFRPAFMWNQIVSGIIVAVLAAISAARRPSSAEPPVI